MVELFANNGDPDQTPHSVASDLGLHCLPSTCLVVSRLQWVKLVLHDHNLALNFDAAQNYKYLLGQRFIVMPTTGLYNVPPNLNIDIIEINH